MSNIHAEDIANVSSNCQESDACVISVAAFVCLPLTSVVSCCYPAVTQSNTEQSAFAGLPSS